MEIDSILLQKLARHDPQRDFDAAHDAYLYLLRTHSNEQITAAMWVHSTKHRACDEHRKISRWKRIQVADGSDLPIADEEPVDKCISNESSQLIRTALERLTPMQREVIIRRFRKNESPLSIAESLKIPLDTVYSRLKLACKSFQSDKVLSAYFTSLE